MLECILKIALVSHWHEETFDPRKSLIPPYDLCKKTFVEIRLED
jgi:hypothetical protein